MLTVELARLSSRRAAWFCFTRTVFSWTSRSFGPTRNCTASTARAPSSSNPRELVENAVDACRGVSDRRAAKVTISVSKCAERGCLVLKVGDNGAGIVDPDESIQLGKSTKGEDEDGPNFGVGLSAVCVYAGELRLVTSRRGVPEALRRHYRVRDKKIVCEQSSVLPSPSDDSGTVVVVALPAGGGGDLTEKVAEYVRRFNLVPHFHTTIRFEARGCLSDMRIEVRPHGDAAWAAYLPPAAGDAEDVKSSKSGAAHAVAEEPSRIPCSVSVALFERDDDDDDDGDGDAAEREQQQPVKVRCVRLANGLPLADDLSSTSCGLFRAVRDVDWGNFGIAVLGGSRAAQQPTAKTNARPCQFVVRGPPHLAAVWVAVHVDATGKFASFTKTSSRAIIKVQSEASRAKSRNASRRCGAITRPSSRRVSNAAAKPSARSRCPNSRRPSPKSRAPLSRRASLARWSISSRRTRTGWTASDTRSKESWSTPFYIQRPSRTKG